MEGISCVDALAKMSIISLQDKVFREDASIFIKELIDMNVKRIDSKKKRKNKFNLFKYYYFFIPITLIKEKKWCTECVKYFYIFNQSPPCIQLNNFFFLIT